MVRTWPVTRAVLLVVITACHHAPAKNLATPPTVARVAMDSAEIERLCTAPDSVRAGKADCVLKDQSAPRQRPLPSPTPPPR